MYFFFALYIPFLNQSSSRSRLILQCEKTNWIKKTIQNWQYARTERRSIKRPFFTWRETLYFIPHFFFIPLSTSNKGNSTHETNTCRPMRKKRPLSMTKRCKKYTRIWRFSLWGKAENAASDTMATLETKLSFSVPLWFDTQLGPFRFISVYMYVYKGIYLWSFFFLWM